MRYAVEIERTPRGYIARVLDGPECMVSGRTVAQVKRLMVAVLVAQQRFEVPINPCDRESDDVEITAVDPIDEF